MSQFYILLLMISVISMEYHKLLKEAKTRAKDIHKLRAQLRKQSERLRQERLREERHEQWLKARLAGEKMNLDLIKAGQRIRRQKLSADEIIVISSDDE